MPKAARVGDPISHTNAYAGLIMGALAGAVIGAAVITTGGVAAVALGACAGFGLGGIIGEFASGFTTTVTGEIITGSSNANTNLRPAAKVGDRVACAWHGGNQFIAEGSSSVYINGFPAARIGDRTTCGGEIAAGSGDTLIGGSKLALIDISPEVPVVAEIIVGVVGLVGGVGEIALAEVGARSILAARLGIGLTAGVGAGEVGSRLGGALFGEGSRGQRQMAIGAGLLAGALGVRIVQGGRADPFGTRPRTSDLGSLAEPKDDIFSLGESDAPATWHVPPDNVPISAQKYNELINMDPQARPLPESYLPDDYVNNHLAQFDEGGSYLVPTKVLDTYGRETLGRPDGSFISTKGDIDAVLARSDGDIGKIETELGIPAGSWNKPGATLSRIDIPNPKSLNIRLPSGREAGANAEWLPGGLLPTGKSEAVVDQIPLGSYNETLIGP